MKLRRDSNETESQLRVCLVVMYFTIGGLERVVVRLANGLVAHNIPTRVIIIETGKRNALVTELDERVELTCLEGSVAAKLSALRRLTHGYITHIQFGDGYIHPLCRFALLGRKPLVITYQSVYSHLRNIVQTRLDHSISGQFDVVVAVSERVRDYCVQELRIPEKKLQVIYNGIDNKTGSPRTDWSNRPLNLVCVASLYKHKNQGILIQGLAAARKMGYEVNLSLVGDGPEMARLFKMACDLGVRSFITWHGAIWRHEAVQAVLDQADVFVTASKWEGFSLALLEAMTTELPIIASDIQPHREALSDCALYFPADNAASLVQAIAQLAKNHDLGCQLGMKSHERARLFDAEPFVEKHMKLYEDCWHQFYHTNASSKRG